MLKWIKKFFAEWKRIENTYGKNQCECCTDCPVNETTAQAINDSLDNKVVTYDSVRAMIEDKGNG